MGWLFIALVAGSWAFAGFQNYALPGGVTETLGLAMAATTLVVWLHGRSHGRARAFAAAYARAEARANAAALSASTSAATNHVQIVVADGARSVAARESAALDGAEWIGDPVPLLEQEAEHSDADDDVRDLLDAGEVIEAT